MLKIIVTELVQQNLCVALGHSIQEDLVEVGDKQGQIILKNFLFVQQIAFIDLPDALMPLFLLLFHFLQCFEKYFFMSTVRSYK